MPFNLQKKYNELLDLISLSPYQKDQSLQSIFDRDIKDNLSFAFNDKPIHPTPIDGEIEVSTLFTHLTTVIVDYDTKKREFDIDRAVRLHWVRYHIEKRGNEIGKILTFSVKEPKGNRTYIYDMKEKYVIILEPLRKKEEYYLLTAYYLRGKDSKRNKIMKKYKRKLDEVL